MFKIIQKSNYWFVISGILMAISIAAISIFGLRIGIDYSGGTILKISSETENQEDIVKQILSENSITGFQVKSGSNRELNIRMPFLETDSYSTITDSFKVQLSGYSEISYDTIGPVIGNDLTRKSITAVVIAIFGIILYIAYAFRRVPKPLSSWKFGLSAVAALIHDLLITIGFVSIVGHYFTWMEVDVLFITALLTILGFSVHDTIVVYDRLRENFIKNPHQEITSSAESSIAQTLARSLNTSFTVVLVLVTLMLIGSSPILHFILTLTFGIIIGTYSSIFIATPILVAWHKK